MTSRSRVPVLVGLFLATLALWDTPVVYPVKVLVVLFHEISHGLAALLTGGRVEHVTLSADLGGVMTSRGGWPLVILPAGYLGSMAWGAALLLGAAWSARRRLLSLLLGALLLGITLVYVRSLFGFGWGLVFGFGLLFLGAKLPEPLNDLVLSFVGLTSMLYSVLDIRDDLISRTVPQSDAAVFSQYVPLPPVVWGVLWGAVALAASAWALRKAAGPPPWAGGEEG